MRKAASHLISSAYSKRQDMAEDEVRELDRSQKARQYIIAKCEDFRVQAVALKISKAGKWHVQIQV